VETFLMQVMLQIKLETF